PADPLGSIFRWQGKPAVGIGIIPKKGINIETFGHRIKSDIAAASNLLNPLKLEVVAFQPQRTKERIDDLLMSLLSGMLLVAVFLGLTVSGATAIIVSASVPIITLIGLFIYYLSGGILHQISIAAFVISIGQFIDNIIVVIDSIQSKIRSGLPPDEAAAHASTELKSPMAFATATGICAFLPMLSAQGSTADFIFSLPLVAVITLITSYFVAIFFTPLLTGFLYRPEKKPWIQIPFTAIENTFAAMALGPYWRIFAIVGIIGSFSVIGVLNVEKEFFPESDRNEFLFAVELNPSADTSKTDKILKEVEDHFSKDPRIQSLASFVGGDIPRFYYNLPNPKAAPQSGQILVTTTSSLDMKKLGLEMEEIFTQRYPEVSFTAQFLQQGPPINAKIEINIFSENKERREKIVSQITENLKTDTRVRSIREDDFAGLKQILLKAKNAQLADIGITRNDLSQMISFYSTGVLISDFRFDRDIIPIKVRADQGPYLAPEKLKPVLVLRGRDRDFRLNDLAYFEPSSEIPILRRENGQTFSRILADLKPGYTFDRVIKDLEKRILNIELKPQERIKYGGDAEGAGEANDSIFKVVPPAMILLLLFLLIEFGSFRKVLIAMLALPVTLMGVFPGLWLGNAPFGFMSLLGILALVGIAINNIILLLEAMASQDNLRTAIAMRLRAILLTTILTLLGLIPLALSESSLWPPLAWTMISGLLTGTISTLIVVPGLYRLFFKGTVVMCSLLFLGTMFSAPQYALAKTGFTLNQILEKVSDSDDVKLISDVQSEAESANQTAWRDAFAPRLTAGGNWLNRDRELQTSSPFGNLVQEKQNRMDAMLELRQPLFDSGKMFASKSAAEQNLEAAVQQRKYNQQALKLKYGSQAMEILIRNRELQFLNESMENLRSRQKDIKRLIDKGRQSRSDLLKLEIALERIIHAQKALIIEIKSKIDDLKSALKIETEFVLLPPKQIRAVSSLNLNSATGDFENLRAQGRSLDFRKQQIKSASLPVIDGYARIVGSEGRSLTDRQWSEAGIELRWELWGGGIRSSQAAQIEAQKSALQTQENLLLRQKATIFSETQFKAQEKMRWMNQLVLLIKKSVASRKDEEKRYFEGRGSLNDLIETDTLGLELQRDKDITGFSLVMDCMQLQLWAGKNVSAECDFPEYQQ
ncbi:MAG: efflux RND transporter permease subunit, partial [Pseudobdellovibrionaceae bacterium]